MCVLYIYIYNLKAFLILIHVQWEKDLNNNDVAFANLPSSSDPMNLSNEYFNDKFKYIVVSPSKQRCFQVHSINSIMQTEDL